MKKISGWIQTSWSKSRPSSTKIVTTSPDSKKPHLTTFLTQPEKETGAKSGIKILLLKCQISAMTRMMSILISGAGIRLLRKPSTQPIHISMWVRCLISSSTMMVNTKIENPLLRLTQRKPSTTLVAHSTTAPQREKLNTISLVMQISSQTTTEMISNNFMMRGEMLDLLAKTKIV